MVREERTVHALLIAILFLWFLQLDLARPEHHEMYDSALN
jgi:hypothetical protein